MVFSSVSFLFLFLPVVLCLHFLFGRKAWNIVLLIASLIFYAWGESEYVLIMLYSVFISYIVGRLLNSSLLGGHRKYILLSGILFNLVPLIYFKYFGFFTTNLNFLLINFGMSPIEETSITLPIGISFFTFQAISYLIDIFRRDAEPQKSILNLGLYISLFPQLIAGPIVRYSDINKQIGSRTISLSDVGIGIERFIIGLSKKVLIANTMGALADSVFSLDPNSISSDIAWLGIIAYTLQIYYDFSGYSDMAIGLCRMFGFRINENFKYPYSATSIQDFWRRWHISLSSWFRDYLYIPLGGNRKGNIRTVTNLFIVFLLCGLWHGAEWTFIAWGLFHGCLLAIERISVVDRLLTKTPRLITHLYTMLMVMFGWVLFRSPTIDYAMDYYVALFSFSRPPYLDVFLVNKLNNEFYTALVIGLLFSQPLFNIISKKLSLESFHLFEAKPRGVINFVKQFMVVAIFLFLFSLSIISTVSGNYNPFLYFRF